MFRFGIGAGISYEWASGAPVYSLQSLGSASIRALMAAMLAWMALEAARALWKTAMMLDDQPPVRADKRPAAIGK